MLRLVGCGRDERNRMIDCLLGMGVQTRPGLMAAHREPAYASGETGASLAVTEQISDDSLALPLFHQMTEVEQDRVVEAVRVCLR